MEFLQALGTHLQFLYRFRPLTMYRNFNVYLFRRSAFQSIFMMGAIATTYKTKGLAL